MKIKVKVILPFVQEKSSFAPGDEILLDDELAYIFAKRGVVSFASEKQFKELDTKLTKEENDKKEAELEAEKKLAALLEKDSLEAERLKLQDRVNAITDVLGDAVVFYKSYIDLADSIAKNEALKQEINKGEEK